GLRKAAWGERPRTRAHKLPFNPPRSRLPPALSVPAAPRRTHRALALKNDAGSRLGPRHHQRLWLSASPSENREEVTPDHWRRGHFESVGRPSSSKRSRRHQTQTRCMLALPISGDEPRDDCKGQHEGVENDG